MIGGDVRFAQHEREIDFDLGESVIRRRGKGSPAANCNERSRGFMSLLSVQLVKKRLTKLKPNITPTGMDNRSEVWPAFDMRALSFQTIAIASSAGSAFGSMAFGLLTAYLETTPFYSVLDFLLSLAIAVLIGGIAFAVAAPVTIALATLSIRLAGARLSLWVAIGLAVAGCLSLLSGIYNRSDTSESLFAALIIAMAGCASGLIAWRVARRRQDERVRP